MRTRQAQLIDATVAHFQEIARQNRFAENGQIPHDSEKCAICHPEKVEMNPFHLYLHVVTQSIKVRRPRLDADLLAQMNEDLSLMGVTENVSLEQLLAGEQKALQVWEEWIRDALSTGLSLLAVHSADSLEFDLEAEEEAGSRDLIDSSIREIMEHQRHGHGL